MEWVKLLNFVYSSLSLSRLVFYFSTYQIDTSSNALLDHQQPQGMYVSKLDENPYV